MNPKRSKKRVTTSPPAPVPLEVLLAMRKAENLADWCHSYKPPLKKPEIELAAKHIYLAWAGDAYCLRALLKTLLHRSSEPCLKLYCELTWRTTVQTPIRMTSALCHVAEHPDWQVREFAASALGNLFDQHFSLLVDCMEAKARNGSPKVKRAVALALSTAGRSRDMHRAQKLLDIACLLAAERNQYVQRNLGPFAIGDGLLRYFPRQTIMALRKWARSTDPIVRLNVASAFTTASARDQVGQAVTIVNMLLNDSDLAVRRAAEKAKRNLGPRLK
jgi:HEAT repeat protein